MDENSKLSEFKYQNKVANLDTAVYNRLITTLKKLDTLYNSNMPIMHDPVIDVIYKVTRDTMVIQIAVDHKEEESSGHAVINLY